MKLSEQSFSWYDRSLISGRSLIEAFRGKEFEGGFHLSGTQDLLETLTILDEYMSIYPTHEFRELASNQDLEVDRVWNEPIDARVTFSRSIVSHCRISQEKETQKRGAEGNVKEKNIQVWLCLVNLIQHDYYPRTGDEFEFRGIDYRITFTTVDPDDYFQLTGLPLYVRCDAEVKQKSSYMGRHVPGSVQEPENPPPVAPDPINQSDSLSYLPL